MQKIPSTVNQTMNNSPIREDNISLANSNNEQNIEFIENGIEQVFLTQDSVNFFLS